MTGDVSVAQDDSARSAGMDDYVLKPYQKSTILEALTSGE